MINFDFETKNIDNEFELNLEDLIEDDLEEINDLKTSLEEIDFLFNNLINIETYKKELSDNTNSLALAFATALDIEDKDISLEGIISAIKKPASKVISWVGTKWEFLKKYYLVSATDLVKKYEPKLNALQHNLSKTTTDITKFKEAKIKIVTMKEFEHAIEIYKNVIAQTKAIMAIDSFNSEIKKLEGIENPQNAYSQFEKLVKEKKNPFVIKTNMQKALSEFIKDITSILDKCMKKEDYLQYYGLTIKKSRAPSTAGESVMGFKTPPIYKFKIKSPTVIELGYNENSFATLKEKLISAYPNVGIMKMVVNQLEKEYGLITNVLKILNKMDKNHNQTAIGLATSYVLYLKMIADMKKMTVSRSILHLKRLSKNLLRLGYIQLAKKEIDKNE